MKNLIVTSDTHFTANPLDSYRLDLLGWLAESAQKYSADVAILGDLTTAFDRHPASLVNQVVSGIEKILQVAEVVILRGNHDYVQSDPPFFKFLSLSPRIKFVLEPRIVQLAGRRILCIPHLREGLGSRRREILARLSRPIECVFMHHTFGGVQYESGAYCNKVVTPLEKKLLRAQVPVFSGDIHKPQTLKSVRYVGAPYHTRFGDSYDPTVLLMGESAKRLRVLRFPAPKKHTITARFLKGKLYLASKAACGTRTAEISAGNHVKFWIEMTPEVLEEWGFVQNCLADYAKRREWNYFGIGTGLPILKPLEKKSAEGGTLSRRQFLEDYCESRGYKPPMRRVGLELFDAYRIKNT